MSFERSNREWLTGSALGIMILGLSGCAVRQTTRVTPAPLAPAVEASANDLVAKINAQSEAIQTLTATVDLEPTAGSVYSGVIKEYRDVRAFILLERPDLIHMVGQAPVVRTTIFDMVSDGKEFRLSIPPKQKFIVGKTEVTRPSKKALENLRPQHILDALLIPAVSPHDRYFVEDEQEGGNRYEVLYILRSGDTPELSLQRKVWFQGSDAQVARLQIYGPGGAVVEDVRYSDYEDFQGVYYPSRVEVSRPVEDYRLGIEIQKASFNQPITPEKFELRKPENEQLIQLSATEEPEGQVGQ